MAELKFDPGFQVIGEYLSQIDSILKVKCTIWLSMSSQFYVWKVKLSMAELKFDPGFQVIGEYLSQIDSILKVKCTIWLSMPSQFYVCC